MKTKYFGAIIALYVLVLLGWNSTPNERAVSFKLSVLCTDNPQYDCAEIVDYCKESLDKGFDCYITN